LNYARGRLWSLGHRLSADRLSKFFLARPFEQIHIELPR
jgi:hypothetical protein